MTKVSRLVQIAPKNEQLNNTLKVLDSRYRLFKIHSRTTGSMTGSDSFVIVEGEYFASFVKSGTKWYTAMPNSDAASYYCYSKTLTGWQSNPFGELADWTWTIEASGVGSYNYSVFALPTSL